MVLAAAGASSAAYNRCMSAVRLRRLVTPIVAAILALAPIGCDTDCACDDQYEECLAEAPPGAAKADCAREYDACQAQCDASRAADETDHVAESLQSSEP